MWRVTVRVTSGANNARSADAQIVDDDGRVVAERTVADKSGGSCLALARAVGAWAQIVLDDELQRAKDEAQKPSVDDQWKSNTTLAVNVPDPKTIQDRTPSDPSQGSSTEAPIEVGSMMFLRNGAADDTGTFGASAFVVYGVGGRWLLRPSLAAGTTTSPIDIAKNSSTNLTYLGGRLDFCRRVLGNYIERRGLELDACAGVDSGALTTFERTAFRLNAGPAVTVRGELRENFALELRGTAGVNLARASVGSEREPVWFVGGVEVGASVRFR